MKPIGEMTRAELAAFVQTALKERGIDVVLSGGSCVSIYSKDKYVSMDLDLVNIRSANWRAIKSTMRDLGFCEKGRHFKHRDTDILIEFPAGPLAIGNEPVKDISEVPCETGRLRIISPTECVKDRLAAYYHWNDMQALEQASLVAQMQDVDLKEIERWSKSEGKYSDFKIIKAQLKAKKEEPLQEDE